MEIGNKYRISDLYALRNHAAEQGKDFRTYLQELTSHNIPLDTAIDNARKGITLEKYVTNQDRTAMIKIGAVMVSLLAGLALLALTDSSHIEVPSNLKGGLFGGEYAAYCGFHLK